MGALLQPPLLLAPKPQKVSTASPPRPVLLAASAPAPLARAEPGAAPLKLVAQWLPAPPMLESVLQVPPPVRTRDPGKKGSAASDA
jgi:hypothetical protein